MPNPPYTPTQLNPPDVALEPTQLRAGDSWTWQRSFDGYAPSDGWALQYILNSPTFRFAFPGGSIVADADGSNFDIALTSAQTSGIASGLYEIYAVLTNAAKSLQQTLPLQAVRVSANLATAAGAVDTRSDVKKILDKLDAAMLSDASPMVQEYEVGHRKVRYTDRIQLKELRDAYALEYRQEQIAKGEYVPQRRAGIAFRPTY